MSGVAAPSGGRSLLHFFPRLVQEEGALVERCERPFIQRLPTLGAAERGQAGRGATWLSPGVEVSRLSSPLPTFPLDTDITVIPNSTGLNQAVAFPVVMYGCESWTIKKAER